jgi:hypothetical protein
VSTSTGFGQLWIGVDGAPADPVVVDARIGFGNVDISANVEVAVEVRSEIDRGDVRLNGQVQDDTVVRFGPDREPDVIVLARVGVGDVNIGGYDAGPFVGEEWLLSGDGPFDPLVEEHGVGTRVTDVVGVSSDGWIVLAGGEAVIDPSGAVVVGDIDPATGIVTTSVGPFDLDGDTLTTPFGDMFGLEGLRATYADPSTLPTVPPIPGPSVGSVLPSVPGLTNTTIEG